MEDTVRTLRSGTVFGRVMETVSTPLRRNQTQPEAEETGDKLSYEDDVAEVTYTSWRNEFDDEIEAKEQSVNEGRRNELIFNLQKSVEEVENFLISKAKRNGAPVIPPDAHGNDLKRFDYMPAEVKIAFDAKQLLSYSTVGGIPLVAVRIEVPKAVHADHTDQIYYVPIFSLSNAITLKKLPQPVQTEQFLRLGNDKKGEHYMRWLSKQKTSAAHVCVVQQLQLMSQIAAYYTQICAVSQIAAEVHNAIVDGGPSSYRIISDTLGGVQKIESSMKGRPDLPMTDEQIEEEVDSFKQSQNIESNDRDGQKSVRHIMNQQMVSTDGSSDDQFRDLKDKSDNRLLDSKIFSIMTGNASQNETRAFVKSQGLPSKFEARQLPLDFKNADDAVLRAVARIRVMDLQAHNLLLLGQGSDHPIFQGSGHHASYLDNDITAANFHRLKGKRPQVLSTILGMVDSNKEISLALHQIRNEMPVSSWSAEFMNMINTSANSNTTPLILSVELNRISPPTTFGIAEVWQHFFLMMINHYSDHAVAEEDVTKYVQQIIRAIAVSALTKKELRFKINKTDDKSQYQIAHLWEIIGLHFKRMSRFDASRLDASCQEPDPVAMIEQCLNHVIDIEDLVTSAALPETDIPIIPDQYHNATELAAWFGHAVGPVPKYGDRLRSILTPTIDNIIHPIQVLVDYIQAVQRQSVEQASRSQEYNMLQSKVRKSNNIALSWEMDQSSEQGSGSGNETSDDDVQIKAHRAEFKPIEFMGKCHNCGKVGHKRSECSKPSQKKKPANDPAQQAAAAEVELTLTPEILKLIDTIHESKVFKEVKTGVVSSLDTLRFDWHLQVIHLLQILTGSKGRMCIRMAFQGKCGQKDQEHLEKHDHSIRPKQVWDTMMEARKAKNVKLNEILVEWLASPVGCVGCCVTNDQKQVIGGTPTAVRTDKNVFLNYHRNPCFQCGFGAYMESVNRNEKKGYRSKPSSIDHLQNKFEQVVPAGLETAENSANMNLYHPLVNRSQEILTTRYHCVSGQQRQSASSKQPPIFVVKSYMNSRKYMQGKSPQDSTSSRVNFNEFFLHRAQQHAAQSQETDGLGRNRSSDEQETRITMWRPSGQRNGGYRGNNTAHLAQDLVREMNSGQVEDLDPESAWSLADVVHHVHDSYGNGDSDITSQLFLVNTEDSRTHGGSAEVWSGADILLNFDKSRLVAHGATRRFTRPPTSRNHHSLANRDLNGRRSNTAPLDPYEC